MHKDSWKKIVEIVHFAEKPGPAPAHGDKRKSPDFSGRPLPREQLVKERTTALLGAGGAGIATLVNLALEGIKGDALARSDLGGLIKHLARFVRDNVNRRQILIGAVGSLGERRREVERSHLALKGEDVATVGKSYIQFAHCFSFLSLSYIPIIAQFREVVKGF